MSREVLAPDNGIKIQVCLGTNGIAAGGKEVVAAFEKALADNGLSAAVGKRFCVRQTGCRGLCSNDVLVDIITPQLGKYAYSKVTPEMVPQIVEEHIKRGAPVEKWVVFDGSDDCSLGAFLHKQERNLLQYCGDIDPESIDDYLQVGGYAALKRVLDEMRPGAVIELVKKSGLRGRGGAGFPVWRKWEICAEREADQKYLVCNAQECDPGTFKDRSIMEGDPHAIIEGMCIAAYAVGASEGFICVNSDYKLALKRLRAALDAAEERGVLGARMLGGRASFKVHLVRGVTTFSCGKSSALLNTLEGRRGYPRMNPPHSAESGLWGKPTVVNNVETLINLPLIVNRGADWYEKIGTETSKGTKIFSLAGAVKNVGLIEVPMGTSLSTIVNEIGGGTPNKKIKFKAVQVGGPLGGCYSKEELDLTVDYENMRRYNSIIGSGGLVVLDEKNCIVEFARHLLEFAQEETCGKCAPCRLGTEVLFEILDRITKGEGREEDLENLRELSEDIHDFALCSLGKMAPNPVLTTIKYFTEEYEAHIKDGICPARKCKALYKFYVDPDLCKKCGICFKKSCKFEAIKWEAKQVAEIDKEKCVKCGACIQQCPFMAIF